MARPKNRLSEYRSYELESDFPILDLQGEEWYISPVRSTRLHFHNCLEVGLCLRKSGGMVIEDREVSFSAGTVTVIAPNVLHTTWSDPGEMSLWSYLYLDPEALLGDALLDIPEIRRVHRLLADSQLILPPEEAPWAAPLVQAMLEELSARATGYRACVRGLLLTFLARLMRMDIPEQARANPQALALAPALSYVHQHYMEAFPMETLAEMCHLSPTHFRRLFQEQVGTNPLDFVHQARIAASCTLLRTTNESIAGIAGRVGYASLSAFNRHFLRIMGETPSHWRQSSEGTHSVLTYSGWKKAETSEEILRKNQ